MYNSGLTDKDCKHAKLFRQLSGIGMIESVSITKGLGCYTLTDLVNWLIDSMATSVDSLFYVQDLNTIVNLFHGCIVSWERTSKFVSLLLAIMEAEGSLELSRLRYRAKT